MRTINGGCEGSGGEEDRSNEGVEQHDEIMYEQAIKVFVLEKVDVVLRQ